MALLRFFFNWLLLSCAENWGKIRLLRQSHGAVGPSLKLKMTYSGTPKVTGVLDNTRSSIVLAKMQHGKFALVTKHFSYFNGSGSET